MSLRFGVFILLVAAISPSLYAGKKTAALPDARALACVGNLIEAAGYSQIRIHHFPNLSPSRGRLLLSGGKHLIGDIENGVAQEVDLLGTIIDLSSGTSKSLWSILPELQVDTGFDAWGTRYRTGNLRMSPVAIHPFAEWAIAGLCNGGGLSEETKYCFVDLNTHEVTEMHQPGTRLQLKNSKVSEDGERFAGLVLPTPTEVHTRTSHSHSVANHYPNQFLSLVWDLEHRNFLPMAYVFRFPEYEERGPNFIYLEAVSNDGKVFIETVDPETDERIVGVLRPHQAKDFERMGLPAPETDGREIVEAAANKGGVKARSLTALRKDQLKLREQKAAEIVEPETLEGAFHSVTPDGQYMVATIDRKPVVWKIGEKESENIEVPFADDVYDSFHEETKDPRFSDEDPHYGTTSMTKSQIAVDPQGKLILAVLYQFDVHDKKDPMYVHREYAVVRWNLSQKKPAKEPEIFLSRDFDHVSKLTFFMTDEAKVILIGPSDQSIVVGSPDTEMKPVKLKVFDSAVAEAEFWISKSGMQIAVNSKEGVHVIDLAPARPTVKK